MASLQVSGEWQLHLTPTAENFAGHGQIYTDPEEITDDLEAAIADAVDGDRIMLDGIEYTVGWALNNWFEVVVERFDAARVEWIPDEGSVIELDRGPSVEEAQRILLDALDDAKVDVEVAE